MPLSLAPAGTGGHELTSVDDAGEEFWLGSDPVTGNVFGFMRFDADSRDMKAQFIRSEDGALQYLCALLVVLAWLF